MNPPDANRRDFLRNGTLAAAGIVATGAAADAQEKAKEPYGHDHHDYPRDHAGPGGPVGSPTDRGKLVPGLRAAMEPPVLVETPDLPQLPFQMVNGVKEFHLIAEPVRRELLPGNAMHFWGYNGGMPGPTIQVTEGDRIRIVLHNKLPEETTLHLHGLELPIAMDGIQFLTQDPIEPGGTFAYEMTVHQTGTFFYHPHYPMQEAIGMVGLLIIHPKKAYTPVVDQDFALIAQEFTIRPATDIPQTIGDAFNWFTFNGRSGPYGTPMVMRLGNRVRIRMVNFSSMSHHPIHFHGHTAWITGTEGGRIPESAWIPTNNILVGVAQVREFEFVANNPGDWMFHCHMFHHNMNHMISGVGPGSRDQARNGLMDPRYRVPGFPQDTGMMAPMSAAEMEAYNKNPLTRGLRPGWPMSTAGLMTMFRVLPPDLYERVRSGKGEVKPGESVPGAAPPARKQRHNMHDKKPK